MAMSGSRGWLYIALAVLLAIAVFQVLLRYQYVVLPGEGTAPGSIASRIIRIDRLTGAWCRYPYNPSGTPAAWSEIYPSCFPTPTISK